jgi:putative transposase
MPAKYQKRVDKKETHFHVLNRSTPNEILFRDKQDYKVFISYLADYLSPLAHPDTYKKEFTIKGQTFEGTPHKNKNYFNDISLIAFDLKPNHFHLLLHQKNKGSIEKFMRSLSTRYSMYYNKKHSRKGKLFEGPYKSIHIDEISSLVILTRFFHKNSEDGHSSYKEYLYERETLWIKPDTVLSFLNSSKNKLFKDIGNYKDFVEKYNLTQKDKKELERIILEKESEHLLKSTPSLASSYPSEEKHQTQNSNLTHIMISAAVFFVLFAIGLNNVITTSANNEIAQSTLSETPMPSVAGEKTEEPTIKLVIKIEDGADSVNIRKEPTTRSEKIGKAKLGDIFEFVSTNSGWYEVKLDGDTIGYIFSGYIEEIINEDD